MLFIIEEKKDEKETDQSEEFCTHPDCVIMASRLIKNMNASADPCHDFYNFACGGFQVLLIKTFRDCPS